jgi:DNA topoisomerase-1
MANNLMIVESPAKAKTIEKYLGEDFTVTSCYGHIRDLSTKKMGVDVENKYVPDYQVPKEKEQVVKDLQKLAKEAEIIWLATDEDREGEAIAWHLSEILDLGSKTVKRIVFHEITKGAIQDAVQSPRSVNMDLVFAQQARRILDRLVGFELSPVLWKKMSFKNALSAGRVQSVAVRLIVEREREIGKFEAESSFRISGVFTNEGGTFKAELPERFKTEAEALEFLNKCKDAALSIDNVEVKPAKRTPNAPFTTSTLQQEASRKLGYSVSRTMTVAQKLYEAGHISYMRTDSVNLSQTALDSASAAIKDLYGEEYSNPQQYKTKQASAQEAHEAIRPTDLTKKDISGLESDQERLYDLIWKRTISSQMADAQLERTTATIGISTSEQNFRAKGEVIKFDGFLKVYVESRDDDAEMDEEDSGILPPMEVGQTVTYREITAIERFSRPPARFAEASLVKKLEELGIGRPSTYAPIISTVQKRGYVTKETREGTERSFRALTIAGGEVTDETRTEITGAEKGKLFPTDIGLVVNDFLVEHFKEVMDYGFTAEVEKEFDDIAEGQEEWVNMIDDFYQPFHKHVEKTTEEADRISGERALGDDPKTGKPIIARVAKYGPVVQMGSSEDEEEKPKFARIRPPMTIETVTLEDALELFKLPRTLGEGDAGDVVAAEGRYGPYVSYDGKFYALKDEFDPLTITLDEAIDLIARKKEEDKKKTIQEFPEDGILVLNGPYGPYIKIGKKNVKIPKDKDPAALTLDECKELIEKAPEKKGRRPRKRK